jgi:SAM-dependent methyltransferase
MRLVCSSGSERRAMSEQRGVSAGDWSCRRQPTSHERRAGQSWDASYLDGPAPWDIGEPQPAILRLAGEGAFAGAVLDAGCGTGENALHVASLGLHVLGVDVAETALSIVREKAAGRGIDAEFVVAEALHWAECLRRCLTTGARHDQSRTPDSPRSLDHRYQTCGATRLAHPLRREMVERLSRGSVTVGRPRRTSACEADNLAAPQDARRCRSRDPSDRWTDSQVGRSSRRRSPRQRDGSSASALAGSGCWTRSASTSRRSDDRASRGGCCEASGPSRRPSTECSRPG